MVCSFQLRESVQLDSNKYLIYCEPVLLNTFAHVSNDQLTNPITIEVEELNMEVQRVTALENGSLISCRSTEIEQDISAQQRYYDDITQLREVHREMFSHHLNDFLYKKIEEFRFEHWWS